MRSGLLAGCVAITTALCALRAAAGVPALYTAAQAEEGEYIFVHKCAECHGSDMEGMSAPPLKGPDFRRLATARNFNAQSLLTFVSLYMPRYAPGSLSPEQYSDLVAFILQQNGYPAGSSELSAATPDLQDLGFSQ
jgi:polar amino acid transport system substrate-binding protein